MTFDPGIYILHAATNDLSMSDTPEEIIELIINMFNTMKWENNTAVFSITILRNNNYNWKTEAVKHFIGGISKKEILKFTGILSRNGLRKSNEYKFCVAQFGTICTISKTWKTPTEECYFKESWRLKPKSITKSNIPPWVFLSRFLNCTNGIKSCNATFICNSSYK